MKTKIRTRKSKTHLFVGAGVVIVVVAVIAFTANPIQSGFAGYFTKKSPEEATLQIFIYQQDRETKSERSDWFNGLKVTVDCDTYNKIALKSGKYSVGQCIGQADVLFTDFMVKELPPMPKDFFAFRQALFIDPLIKRIRFDPERFNESYWLQPEWVVPFEDQKIPVMRKRIEDPRYGAVWGVGTWDDKIVKINKPPIADEDITENIYAWIEPVPATQGYLGVGLRKVYPPVAEFVENTGGDYKSSYYQDPVISEKYLDLKIEPQELLLNPNFPYFYPGYRKMIKLTLIVKKDTPAGIYIIGMQPDAPSKKFSEEHRLQDPVNYWDPYGGFARIGSPYQIFVEVNT